MNNGGAIEIERWPELDCSGDPADRRRRAGFAVGKRFEIKQPLLTKLVWEVTEPAEGGR